MAKVSEAPDHQLIYQPKLHYLHRDKICCGSPSRRILHGTEDPDLVNCKACLRSQKMQLLKLRKLTPDEVNELKMLDPVRWRKHPSVQYKFLRSATHDDVARMSFQSWRFRPNRAEFVVIMGDSGKGYLASRIHLMTEK